MVGLKLGGIDAGEVTHTHTKRAETFAETGAGMLVFSQRHEYASGYMENPLLAVCFTNYDAAVEEASSAGDSYEAYGDHPDYTVVYYEATTAGFVGQKRGVTVLDFCNTADHEMANTGCKLAYSGTVPLEFPNPQLRVFAETMTTADSDGVYATVEEGYDAVFDYCIFSGGCSSAIIGAYAGTEETTELNLGVSPSATTCNPIYPGVGAELVVDHTRRVDLDVLRKKLDSSLKSALIGIRDVDEARGPARYGDRRLVVFTPSVWNGDDWLSPINNYYVPFCSGVLGYDVHVVTIDGYPADNDLFRATLKGEIYSQYVSAVQSGQELYVHLIGDSNDWEMWSEPSSWSGSESWQQQRAYICADANYPNNGEPQYDVLPTYYCPLPTSVPTGPGDVPWVSSDWPYQDVVGDDGVPDVTLSRWPVSDLGGLYSRIQNSQTYYNSSVVAPYEDLRSEMWMYDSGGTPNQVLAFELDRQLAREVLPEGTRELYTSEHTYAERLAIQLNRFDQGVELLTFVGISSWEHSPAGYLDGIDPVTLAGVKIPYCIGASCYTGMYGRTRHQSRVPACESFGNSGFGFIAVLGATGDSWAYENGRIMEQHLSDLRSNYGQESIARTWLRSQQAMCQETQSQSARERYLYSYALLGDPWSVLSSQTVTTGATEDLPGYDEVFTVKCYPNPFNPCVTIQYTIPERQEVSVSVYDLAGCRVKTLYRGEQGDGQYSCIWKGRDDSGRSMPSGAYLCRVQLGDRQLCRRIVLVK